VEVQCVVPLLSELNLFEVDLNAYITHIDVLESDVFVQVVGAPVGDVSECVQDLFGPVLEKRFVVDESLAQVSHDLLDLSALLDLEEILVVVLVGYVIEAQVAGEILGEEEFLGCTNLVEELGEHLVMGELLRDLKVLHWEVFVRTVGHLLDDACLVLLKHFDGLLPVVHTPHSPEVKLLLQSCFLLLDIGMRQLNVLVVCAIDLVPHESKYIFALSMDVLQNLSERLFCASTLLLAFVDNLS
jgi:hypothetical protein